MAILSSDHTYVTVEWGDTLSGIAQTYKEYMDSKATYKTLAAINNIPNPDLIYPNQKIYLKKKSDSGGSKKTSMSKPKIVHFGVQSNSENTIFATWDWDQHSNTDHYEVIWTYGTGDGIAFVGTDTTTKFRQSTWTIPSNAIKVRVKVKPVSKTYKHNNKDTKYFKEKWSNESLYVVEKKAPKPATPNKPDVSISNKNKLTVRVDDIASDAKKIEYQIVKNDKTTIKKVEDSIRTTTSTYTLTVDAGGNYKARCRTISNKKVYSDWSPYSSNEPSFPSAPAKITEITTRTATSVRVKWSKVSTATSYTIQWTHMKTYFDSSPDNVDEKTINEPIGAPTPHTEITGMETGKEYFFRVRATNKAGDSDWTPVKSIIIGRKPSAPTTWSSTTTAIVGEEKKVHLYWVHNSEDGSSQTWANLEITTIIDDVSTTETIQVKNTTDEELKDKTSAYPLSITSSKYKEGAVIKWRVQTKGILAEYSDWSVLRTIDVYAKPTLDLSLTDAKGVALETLTSFPFNIEAVPGPDTQIPIGYHVEITANRGYDTVDAIGNPVYVSKGDAVYSKFFDISNQTLDCELSAQHLDLENNISYTVKCVVSMDSGLIAEDSATFDVSWTDEEYAPNASISIDKDELTALINPYCAIREVTYHVVTRSSNTYKKTSTTVDSVYGESVGAITTTGEEVYYGSDDEGNDIYYCEVVTVTKVKGATLSIYRREYDGRFVEIMTGITNNNTFAVDPHPALDYARYRIVAISPETGSVSFTDLSGEPVNEPAVIIQWAEEWSSYNIFTEDALEEPEHTSSMLKLPYNIDVSDSNDPDVSLVEYAGRSHPVSYYGTQLGTKATWSVEVPKEDTEALYALRRLQIWMGDVYVREPSGSGYWANIRVSFSQKHCDVTIPVTLDITRVEGGM